MTKKQSNYFNMIKAVDDVFSNCRAVWEEKTLLVACYERLHGLNERIVVAAAKQKENAPEGHTAAKENARTMLEDRLFVMGRRLLAFAYLQKDTVAATQADFSRSSLDNYSVNNLLSFARAIFKLCEARLSLLKDYEIDDAAMKDFQAVIDRLANLNAHRDAMVGFRMESTASIASLLSKARQELEIMDSLVEGFIVDEAFLTVYFNARRIHDVRGGSRKRERDNVEK
ncbi:MAG: hypothetical protein LBR81_05435 [Prevotellaceae bacterium]|jgi:hypothetical protein|nr:hypothetical protein [Prevotellaceae bacterium]